MMIREIYERYKASNKGKEDIHTRLMKRYKDIPSWWFYFLLTVTLLVSLALCIFMKDQIQMPWWGLIFASILAFVFTLPISIITATTNQVISHAVNSIILSDEFPCLTSSSHVIADTRVEHNHRVSNGSNIPRKTNSKCVLQNLWLHEHGSSSIISQ